MIHEDELTTVAQNLTSILHLWEQLIGEAINQGDHPDIPGGRALIALAPVANQEAWDNMQSATERYGKPYTCVDDEDDETAFQRIRWWSDRWRRHHGAEYGQDPTIATEISFIRYNLPWARLNEREWQQFADDMDAARINLENIVRDGHRDIYSDEVVCLLCETTLRRRMGLAGYEDEWWCASCRVHLTAAQFNLAASHAARRQLGLD